MSPKQSAIAKQTLKQGKSMAVRTVELSQPLFPLVDNLQFYWSVRVFLTWEGTPIGSIDIANEYHAISVETLEQAIAVNAELQKNLDDLLQHRSYEVLPQEYLVSVIIPTCDRPAELHSCLTHLLQQESSRLLEIIVVDNRPASGITPPVVAEFPSVKLVNEYRPGASYARNTGVIHSQGDIIVTLDDDVAPSPRWLEYLLHSFNDPKVMAVTGNILPFELETPAQQIFEIYGVGGLCRGFRYFKADQAWLKQSTLAAPVWELGVTANAAFRASVFRHPEVGLWEEMLGAGVPVGGGEDIFLFYQILRAGFIHVYEPRAFVWHKHRRDTEAFRRQIHSYSQGVIAHHLMTFRRYRDWRALFTVITLPSYYLKRAVWSVMGKLTYPLSLLMQEVFGHMLGVWGLWRSHRHVHRYGKSQSLTPKVSGRT